jgi:hypothetical protein
VGWGGMVGWRHAPPVHTRTHARHCSRPSSPPLPPALPDPPPPLPSQSDVVLDDMAPTKRLHDLGLEATSMEQPGFTFLHRFRSGSHFLDLAKKV